MSISEYVVDRYRSGSGLGLDLIGKNAGKNYLQQRNKV
jgi:hypothetical protein